jgi:protease-4
MSKSSFWPSFWGAFVGFIVANLVWCIIGLILFFAVIGALVGSMSSVLDGKKSVSVKSNSILHITLNEQILERSNNSPLQNFNFMDFQGAPLGLNQIVSSIEEAKDDEKISGIYLDISSIPTGIATLEEIRNAILDFKTSKKFVVAYSEEYAQGAYYLATAADKIYLNPQGMLDFKGLSRKVMFYKKLLDKLEVDVQVFRHGKYKSATEPFFLDKMSNDNRIQTMAYIRSIWDYIVEGISKQRNISVEELNRYADNMLITDAESALNYKLVDTLVYKDEMLSILGELVKEEKQSKINYITLRKYITAVSDHSRNNSKDQIAVVYASGEISGGNGDDQSIGSERISKAIREAREDENVKAIVLRVNSPGGSALASDVIWREMVLAKKAKPVVVSMGDVAASGGYYIACAADAIVAHPNTITGSIGVFGLIPNAQKLFENKLGITVDTVNTNKHSDIMNLYRPVSKEEGEVIQKWINDTYTDFITKVGEGRKMKPEQIDSIGQGRVWSGAEAKKIGLVDEFGGLKDAIALAADKAELKEYDLLELPKLKEPLEEFINNVAGKDEVIERKLKKELGDTYENYKQLKNIMKYKGVQMRLPYDIILY